MSNELKFDEHIAHLADLVLSVEHFCGCIMGHIHTNKPISIKELERLCQQARESIVAINDSRAVKDVAQQQLYVNTPQVSPCALAGNLSIGPAGVVADERKNI